MAGLVACGSSTDSGQAEQVDPEPPSPSVTPLEEDEAVVAYTAMWEDAVVASRTSDVDHPRLDDHAADNGLMLLEFIISWNADNGHVARGRPSHEVSVVESSAEKRVLQDCLDETEWLLYTPEGDPVDDLPGNRRTAHATVELRESRWLVTDLYLEEPGTC
ncbi:hypothetical protein [Streptomyces profundus]|uniref:hypothetical protein n=1 Tax=Streptomyces profundus TaxID=2867410 RepID=UPI001D1664AD|nr:hypothetical protein [Streptomyces sp. MA3_2.13]UED86330.1 hypothetical protein K4G22_20785 [Streptomyces sp. MA3_2.13]